MKDSFILYIKQKEIIEKLSNEQAGKLIKAIYEYAETDVMPTLDDEILNFILIPIRQQIDYNAEQYEHVKKTRSNAGKQGGRGNKKPENIAFEQAQLATQIINTDTKCKFAPDSVEVESFIDDFKTYKNADFEPTTAERKNIAIVLSELDGYNEKYWQKVFISAKGGYLINGQTVPCNLRKILLEHNSIYAGEANLAPNKEHIEQVQDKKTAHKKAVEKEYAKQAEIERKEREQARAKVQTADEAVEFLNKYVHGNTTTKRISSDFKEFSKLFGIEIDENGKFVSSE